MRKLYYFTGQNKKNCDILYEKYLYLLTQNKNFN